MNSNLRCHCTFSYRKGLVNLCLIAIVLAIFSACSEKEKQDNKKGDENHHSIRPPSESDYSNIPYGISEKPKYLKETFYQNENLDLESICMMAKSDKKPLILYFTGDAVVNARKFEDQLKRDEKLIELAKIYNTVALSLDDEGMVGTKTIGEQNMEIFNHFLPDKTPQFMFVIIDENCKVVKSFQSTNAKEIFTEMMGYAFMGS